MIEISTTIYFLFSFILLLFSLKIKSKVPNSSDKNKVNPTKFA